MDNPALFIGSADEVVKAVHRTEFIAVPDALTEHPEQREIVDKCRSKKILVTKKY